jgi:hypothetical protein
MLKTIGREAKRRFPAVDLRSALHAGRISGVRSEWLVIGTVAGERYTWRGIAEDANHAKYQAWKLILLRKD